MMERREIEQNSADGIAARLQAAYSTHCATPAAQ